MGPRDFHYSTLRVLEREVGGAGGGCLISRVLGGLLAWAGLGRLLGAFGPALAASRGGWFRRALSLWAGSWPPGLALGAWAGSLPSCLGPAWAQLGRLRASSVAQLGRLPECQLLGLFF